MVKHALLKYFEAAGHQILIDHGASVPPLLKSVNLKTQKERVLADISGGLRQEEKRQIIDNIILQAYLPFLPNLQVARPVAVDESAHVPVHCLSVSSCVLFPRFQISELGHAIYISHLDLNS